MDTEAWTVASPVYVAAHGNPSSVADLGKHVLIGNFDRTATWSFRMPDGDTQEIEFRPANVISDSAALAPMLIGGAGTGRLPDFIVRDAIASGSLVSLFEDLRGDIFKVHALYTSHRSLSAKVRVFIDALVEFIAAKHQQ
jgi:DNA-binding transcriptional LysR family regulator